MVAKRDTGAGLRRGAWLKLTGSPPKLAIMSILVPSNGAECWKRLLADPEKHWAKGYSAPTLAHCREGAPGNVRYQLLHRAASALIEAKRFGAPHAVMLVHSFSPSNLWLDDFAECCKVFKSSCAADRLASTTAANRIALHLGWGHGDERYRER